MHSHGVGTDVYKQRRYVSSFLIPSSPTIYGLYLCYNHPPPQLCPVLPLDLHHFLIHHHMQVFGMCMHVVFKLVDVLSVHALIDLTLSLLFTHMPPTPTPLSAAKPTMCECCMHGELCMYTYMCMGSCTGASAVCFSY